jgi:hypothetical protein
VELEGDLVTNGIIVSLQQARELGEEEASERLGIMDQSGAIILPRKTAGPVPCFYTPTQVAGKFVAEFGGSCSPL